MATRKRTLYSILGVAPNADAKAIDAAFQSCIKRLQDRVATGDELANAEIDRATEAYATLSTPLRRERYDDELEAEHATSHSGSAASSNFMPMIVIGALVVALALGWFVHRRHVAAEKAAIVAEEERRADEDAKAAAAAAYLKQQDARADQAALERRQADENQEIRRLQSSSQQTGSVQRMQETSLEMQKRWDNLRADQQKHVDEIRARQDEIALQRRQQQELDKAHRKLESLERN